MCQQAYGLMNAALTRAEADAYTPPEDKPSGLKCSCCLEDIMQGEHYYKVDDGTRYCEYCITRTQAVDEW